MAAVLHRISLHHPPQVLPISLDPEASTTSGCGIPLLSRRSGLAPQCMRGTSFSRYISTFSIPSRPCPEGLSWGSGKIRHTDTTIAPSLISFVVSSDCPDEHIFSSFDAQCVSSGGLLSSSDKHHHRRSSPCFSIQSSPPTFKTEEMVFDGLIFVAMVRRISDGFIGAFSLCVELYISYLKNILVDSPGSFVLSPFLLSVKGDVPSVSLSSMRFSFLTGLLFYVPVYTRPEDASKITLVFLVGESCLSTSHGVTNFQLSRSVVKALSTHLSFVLNSLSSSVEELSRLSYVVIALVYAFYSRGWMLPSCCCNGKG